MPAGNHCSCIDHLGLAFCSHESNYHDSLQAFVIEETDQRPCFQECSSGTSIKRSISMI